MTSAHNATRAMIRLAASLTLLAAAEAGAVGDALKCQGMRDPLRFRATADIISESYPGFSASGCVISKAKHFCVPARAANMQPPPPGPELSGQPLEGAYVCYRARCSERPPDGEIIDQFGSRSQKRYRTSLLCVPAQAACTPTSCAFQGKNCGTIADGCGGTLECGTCAAPETCGGAGPPNVCGTPSATCAEVPVPVEPVNSGCRQPFPPPAGVPCNVPETGPSYYVSATAGSDANDGTTPDQAWATLCRAVASAPSGSTIRVAAGTYATAAVTVDRALTIKGGYDTSFADWDPDQHATVFAGQLTLSHDQAVFGGFQMISRPVGQVGDLPWGSWHRIEAGTLVRNYVEIVYRASVDQYWFYAILASAPNGRTSRILCNDVYIRAEAAPGGFLNTNGIEYGNLALHLGTSELSGNRICLDDRSNGWVSEVISGYGTCGSTPATIVATNNVIENAVVSEPSEAIEFYGCGQTDLDLVLTNNTILSAGAGLGGYEGPPSTVRWKLTNNIIAGTASGWAGVSVGSGAVQIVTSENNLVFGFVNNQLSPVPLYADSDDTSGAHTLSSVFTNADAGDLHPRPAGPAIGTGLNVYGDPAYGSVTVDLEQMPRPGAAGPWDRGAYAE